MPQDPVTNLAQKIIESESFKARFAEIQTNATKGRLSFDVPEIEGSKVGKLILQGSVLALSDNVRHRGVSQKINALLHEIKPTEELVSYAVQILSSRLGNFPVISVDSRVFGENNLLRKIEEGTDATSSLDPEIIGSLYAEEEESRLQIKDKILHFNLFQKEILDALSSKALISFSAPTSFGTSFIVRHHLARLFANGTLSQALIIVPTKSLIDDFYEGILKLKRDLDLDFKIFTHARSMEAMPEKSVFILTQERLSFLIEKNPDFVRTFQVVYCDEAHYISRGYRGFVLRSVLRHLVNLCGIRTTGGNTQYIFSSPLIKNPQYYKDKLFPELSMEQSFHKEIIYSPVEKNIHLVAKSERGYGYHLLRDALNGETFRQRLEEIGTQTFPRNLQRTSSEKSDEKEMSRDVHIVLNSNLDARTILYTTNPLKAHKYAYTLAERLEAKNSIDPREVADLGKYIKDHYDESFGLIDLIKKGVGLHYGRMPIGLRRTMVKLFEQGHIDYLVCTSTLLEGVNLPAKNIFLFSNKQGGNQKHTTLSFWNLVGRAGRITYGLSGNIFCLADKVEKYKELVEDKDAQIKDPEAEVSENSTKRNHVIKSFLESAEQFTYLKSTNRSDIEYLIYELLTVENPEGIVDRFSLPLEKRDALLAAIQSSKESLTIPLVLVKRNPGIDPRLQDHLLATLNASPLSELRVLFEIASNPLAINKLSLSQILNRTSGSLSWPKSNPRYDVIDSSAGRITQWLHETSIAEFIQQALRHLDNTSPEIFFDRIDTALNVVNTLDTEISYSAPKYIKCLFDIALHNARSRGMSDTETYEEKVEAFLFSIESGISSFIGRFLFEKGISRPLAIRTNSLLEEIAGGSSVSRAFFNQPDVIERLRTGLSRVAFDELMEHLAE